jgi:DUF4097 and DUF4098 domain-containing protein YvlB
MSDRLADVVLLALSGLLFIAVGAAALTGVEIPHPVALALIIAGLVVIFLGFTRSRPGALAIVVLIFGLVVLASSGFGFASFSSEQQTKTVILTTADVQASEVLLTTTMQAGNIEVQYSSNESLVCKIIVTYPERVAVFGSQVQAEPTIEHQMVGDRLSVNVEGSAGQVKVTIGPHVRSSLVLTATAGNVVVISSRGDRLESVDARTTAGNVRISVETDSLRTLNVATTAGNADCDLTLFGTQGVHVVGDATLGSASITMPEGALGSKTSYSFDYTTAGLESANPAALVDLRATVGSISLTVIKRA